MQGGQSNEAGNGLLDGVILEGWRRGASVHFDYDVRTDQGFWSSEVCATASNYTIDDAPNTVSSPASGSVYGARAWVRSSTGTPSVRAVLRESGGGALRTNGTAVTVSSTWQLITVKHTVSSGVSSLGVFYEVESGGSGTCFLIDDASLAQLDGGGGGGGCTPETDPQFCSRLGKNCGSVTALDNCGVSRTVSSCGTCNSGYSCAGEGTANVCGQTVTYDLANSGSSTTLAGQDAYVMLNGSSSGSGWDLFVDGSSSFTQWAYLKFTLPSGGPITSVVLSLLPRFTSSAGAAIYSVSSYSWRNSRGSLTRRSGSSATVAEKK
jgi:hypothetical protein